MKLTDLSVSRLPTPERGYRDYRDDTLKGFLVRVGQQTKTFYLMHGKARTRTKIGTYPVITLAQARQKARELLAEQTLGTKSAKPIEFQDALAEYLDSYTGRKASTTHYVQTTLNRHFKHLGHERVGDITTDDIARVIDRLRDKPTTARHALSNIRMFFAWALERKYALENPCTITPPQKPRSRERVLTDEELTKVLSHATGYPFGVIVQLLILTGQRRSEIGLLKWEYINGDTITLPPVSTKTNRYHTFPIGHCAQQIIKDIPRTNNPYLFHGRNLSEPRPFTNWSYPKALLDKHCPLPHWTLHDLRRTFSTGWAALGIRQEVTEKMLNHVSGGSLSQIARIYNRHTYLDEMREAVQRWEAHLQSLRSG